MVKIISNGRVVNISSGSGGSLTDVVTDSSLTMSDDGIMGVTSPVQSILTRDAFNALSEDVQNKGLYVVYDPSDASATSIFINGQEHVIVGALSLPEGTVSLKPLTKTEYEALSNDR